MDALHAARTIRCVRWPNACRARLRFLGVGGLGLLTDFCVFTILMGYAPRPLLMRLVSLAAATLVTWRLNRALTFDHSGRHQGDEAMRYAVVTAVSQGTSYAVFAALVLTVFAWLPQAALLIGAGRRAGRLQRPPPVRLRAARGRDRWTR